MTDKTSVLDTMSEFLDFVNKVPANDLEAAEESVLLAASNYRKSAESAESLAGRADLERVAGQMESMGQIFQWTRRWRDASERASPQ